MNSPVRDKTITMSSTEFEQIKAQLIHLHAELNRLLGPPLVYATVVKADDKPLGKDGGEKVVVVFDGKLLEVLDSPGVTFKPSDNVKVDLKTRQIRP